MGRTLKNFLTIFVDACIIYTESEKNMEIIIAIFLCVFMGMAAYAACIEADERKRNYRNGTHDYYGNEINDNEL